MEINNQIQILIVDDIAENLQVLGNILSDAGYNTNFAINGLQAIEIAPELMPDLILLDINMPDINGYQVCETLKNNRKTKDIPIVFLTALNELKNMVEGFAIGGSDYISKPFNSAELLSRVKVHAELKKSKDIIDEQNKKLKEKNEQLEELILTKDRLFSIVAHDLKNPFNTLLGFLKLMLMNFDSYDKAKIKENINLLYEISQRTYSLLENLVAWRMILNKNYSFSATKCKFYEILEAVMEELTNMAQNKNIKIKYSGQKETEVFAEENMLKTILRNLITNSIKFTHPNGEINIIIEKGDSETLVTVEDTGVGMDEETAENLFKPEKIVSKHGTNQEKGTGLGLAICYEFVEKHNGRIWAESELNRGSKIKFTLPILDE